MIYSVFVFQVGVLGALFQGLSLPKSPMPKGLGPKQLNDGGMLEIAH